MSGTDNKVFFHSNISKLIFINFVNILVLSLAFLIVIKTFNQVNQLIERDLSQKMETALSGFVLGKEIIHLGEQINKQEDTLLNSPETMIAGRQEVLASFDDILRKIKLTDNYYRLKDTYTVLLAYRQAIGKKMTDNVRITKLLLRLNLLNEKYLATFAAMEVEVGNEIIAEVLGGQDPTGLHQINALIPFCRENILRAVSLMERAVITNSPDQIVPAKDSGDNITVLSSITNMLQTVETLTSAGPSISDKAISITGTGEDYINTLHSLVEVIIDKEKQNKETIEKQKDLISALSLADSEMLVDLKEIASNTGRSMSSARVGLYVIAVIVLLVSLLAALIAMVIGKRISKTEIEKEKSRQSLTEQMKNLNEEIVKRKQAEKVVVDLNQKLEGLVEQRTTQLNTANLELEALVYSMSHDLRTPLRGISGFSNALINEYKDKIDGSGQIYLKRIEHASINMGKTIDAILDLSRMSRAKIHKEKAKVSIMAEAIIEELKKNDPNRQVKVDIEPNLTAFADLEQLRSVLDSLLSNAWKFTAKEDEPKISLEEISDSVKENVFMVKDNGVGFNMDYSTKMFGAFQRLHSPEEFSGAGIGLALVQRVIQRHGGKVWAEGKEGWGAKMYFSLPKN